MFGSMCYILIDREQRCKMNLKSDQGIFLGYSINNKICRAYKNLTKAVMESINATINDASQI